MAQDVKKRIKTGFVISDKMDKTRIIKVEGMKKDPVYEKYLKSENKYYAHDPENKSKIGDKVTIQESRPISRMKRWVVSEILEKAK